ncbi:unnamed protein product [Parnassius apollo]|uniref:Regulatory protein zeste n=1 Tax=Parnassius apollo TaxID=110799 RepID=A0A8S3X7B6_PARAO|nr:unnamed protein product [Parnassius apollo]
MASSVGLILKAVNLSGETAENILESLCESLQELNINIDHILGFTADTTNHLLMDLVRERVLVIESKNTDTNTNSNKLAAWADLLCSFNSMCKGGTRTLPQIKSQWSIIKITKTKIKSVELKNLRQTGGGPPPTTNPEYADDICSWLSNEFVNKINQIGEPSQNEIKVDDINKLVNVENKSSDIVSISKALR